MIDRKIVALGLVFGLACASHAASWDLLGDWTTTGDNPNGTWTYGELVSGSFVKLMSVGSNMYGSEYGAVMGTPLIYRPTSAYGVTAGDVDLDANDADPDARWTAPTKGSYTITASVGNLPGNTFASNAVLDIDGVAQAGTYVTATNVKTWSISDVSLTAGETLDLYVVDPGLSHPDTQTSFTIVENPAATPEPAPLAALGLGALGLLLRRRK